MEGTNSFGLMLKQRRKAVDLTQTELADRIGYSPSTVRMIECGERRASRQVAELLADHLRVGPDERGAFLQAARAAANSEQAEEAGGATGGTKRQTLTTPDLPTYLTTLVGREQEMEAVESRLLRKGTPVGPRLLTLTGPAGIGKTLLASHVASDLQGQFADGACFVSLAAVRTPEMVLSTIARTTGMRVPNENTSQQLLDALKKHLLNKELLLVLDNMEQVVEAGPWIADLLRACVSLKALVTSREPLHVRGESVFPVPPLLLPDLRDLPPLDALLDYPAIALFVERAQEAVPSFALTEANARSIAAICSRVDGLPLAIELVAARVRLFSPRALLARLEERHGHEALRLFGDGARDLPERHRTLQAAIAWSYDLLNEEEQTLFVRIGVFVGGCTLPAIEAVCNAVGDLRLRALEGVSSLLDKSLLKRGYEEDAEEEPRFELLETVREYALLQMEAPGQEEADKVARWHAEYYLTLVEAAEPHRATPAYKVWLDRLERDHDNLRAALAWSLSRDVGLAARLSGSLWLFWETRGYVSEGERWLESVLTKNAAIPPLTRAKVLRGAGWFASVRGDYGRAVALLEGSLLLFRELDHKESTIRVLNNLGQILLFKCDYDSSTSVLDESLALSRELGDRSCLAKSLHMRAWAASDQGEHSRSAELLEESISLSRAQGDRLAAAYSLHNLGLSVMSLGDHDRARELLEESLALFREQGDKLGITSALKNLGWLACEMEECARAQGLLVHGLALLQELGDKKRTAEYLEAIGGVSVGLKQPERAAYLLGAAQALRDTIGAPVPPREKRRYDQILAAIRAGVGEATFAQAWARGTTSSPEQIAAYALDVCAP